MVLFFQISQKSTSIEVVLEKSLIVAYEIENKTLCVFPKLREGERLPKDNDAANKSLDVRRNSYLLKNVFR